MAENSSYPKSEIQFLKVDLITLAICCVGLAFFTFLLISDQAFNIVFGISESNGSEQMIGTVTLKENDVRKKAFNSFSWQNIGDNTNIYLGDGIFTGEKSHSRVLLNKGSQIDLSSNSLVIFSRVEGIEVPNLISGGIKLKVNGNSKLSINGNVGEFNGDNSIVEVTIDENEGPQIKLESGTASYKAKGEKDFLKLETKTPFTLDSFFSRKNSLHIKKIIPPAVKIDQLNSKKELIYKIQLYDLFTKQGNSLVLRDSFPEMVPIKHRVDWITEGSPSKTILQFSNKSHFGDEVKVFNIHSSLFEFSQAYIGNNYWRISVDGSKWTNPSQFKVDKTFLETKPLQLSAIKSNLKGYSDERIFDLKLQGDPIIQSYIIEISPYLEFKGDSTKVIWAAKNSLQYTFQKPGIFYLRARGVNKANELTACSAILTVNIGKSLPLEEIAFSLNKTTYEVGESISMEWKPVVGAKLYHAKIENNLGNIIYESETNQPPLNWKPAEVGSYSVKLTAQDQKNRPIGKGILSNLMVVKKESPMASLPDATQKIPRSVAAHTPDNGTKLSNNPEAPPGYKKTLDYTAELYDYYELQHNSLVAKDFVSSMVRFGYELTWTTEGNPEKIYVQHSNSMDFTGKVFIYETRESKFDLSKLFIGNNYWRVSSDKINWTDPNNFVVTNKFLKIEPPEISILNNQNLKEKVKLLQFQGDSTLKQYILEISRGPQFKKDQVKFHLVSTNKFKYQGNGSGVYYLRIRGINSNQQITSYSKIITINF